MSLKKFLIKFSLILIVFSVFIGKSFSLEPKEFVQSVANEASLILTNNSTKEQKIEKLKSIAKKSVDFRGIGYYSLGAHRKNLSDDKKKEYLNIFEKYFLKSFSSRLAEYTDPKIRVDSQKKLNEKYTGLVDINRRELFTVVPLLAITIFLGIYPRPFLDMIKETMNVLIDQVVIVGGIAGISNMLLVV